MDKTVFFFLHSKALSVAEANDKTGTLSQIRIAGKELVDCETVEELDSFYAHFLAVYRIGNLAELEAKYFVINAGARQEVYARFFLNFIKCPRVSFLSLEQALPFAVTRKVEYKSFSVVDVSYKGNGYRLSSQKGSVKVERLTTSLKNSIFISDEDFFPLVQPVSIEPKYQINQLRRLQAENEYLDKGLRSLRAKTELQSKTLRACNKRISVSFGRYVWIVLEQQDKRTLLITRDAIEKRPFDSCTENHWEESEIRAYLNGEFYKTAFTDEEREQILQTELKTERTTKDYVFLLSVDEAERYFDYDEARACLFEGEFCWYWLRSPSVFPSYVASVYRIGAINPDGVGVFSRYGGVRPALWVGARLAQPSSPLPLEDNGIQETLEIVDDENTDEEFFLETREGRTPYEMYGTGKYVHFGQYDWLVLAQERNRALLISRDAIGKTCFDSKYRNSWAISEIRAYLNGEFYKTAFSDEEREQILQTELKTEVASKDYVFLLSVDEAESYFSSPRARICLLDGDSCPYWLRSSGKSSYRASIVDRLGLVCEFGQGVQASIGIRPAVWLEFVVGQVWSHENESKQETEGIASEEKTRGSQKREEIEAAKKSIEVLNTWKKIRFGQYEWLVLQEHGDQALLFCGEAIAERCFDERSNKWETSGIRAYLNGEFYKEAFSLEEQERIIEVELKTGGCITKDKLFLLSIAEIEYYLKTNETRRCLLEERPCWYWLRSSGHEDNCVASVRINGIIYTNGDTVNYAAGAVRPALLLDQASKQVSAINQKNDAQEKLEEAKTAKTEEAGSSPTMEEESQEASKKSPSFEKWSKGQQVQFGQYEWIVLKEKGNQVLLISRNAVEKHRFDESSNSWEKSEVRTYLNTVFLKKAFSAEEQKRIIEVEIETADSITKDKVFLLSLDEIGDYFDSDEARKCWFEGKVCLYWLRSSGRSLDFDRAAVVFSDGSISGIGYFVRLAHAVRPALWINRALLQTEAIQDSGNQKELAMVKPENTQLDKTMQSQEKATPTKSPSFKKWSKGQQIKFGQYEWFVLEEKRNQVLLISRYAVEKHRFDKSSNSWEKSEVRTYLNTVFLKKAFSAEEQKKIIEVAIKTENSTTKDKVFLLSLDEVKGYFSSDKERKCLLGERRSGCWYWLRSSGGSSNRVALISREGVVHKDGNIVNCNTGSVRPALLINRALLETDSTQDSGNQKKLAMVKSGNTQLDKTMQSQEKARPTKSLSFKKWSKGQQIKFGQYEWIVLERQDNRALLITRNAVENRRFDERSNIWKNSELRAYLNTEFFNKAFSVEEQKRIIEMEIKTENSTTKDKIFLLSIAEIGSYFDSKKARRCLFEGRAHWYWLRSSGSDSDSAAGVNYDGVVSDYGDNVDDNCAVRPALWVDLQS